MKTLKYSLLIVMLVASVAVSAQKKYFMRDHRKTKFINNVDLSVGMYNPSLEALNKYSSLSDVGASFDGGLYYGLEAYAHLYMDGYLGLTTGYYSDEATGQATVGGIPRGESLTYTAIPIGGKFIHEFHLGDPFMHRPKAAGLMLVHPYIGIGTSYWFMTEEFVRDAPGNNQSETLKGGYQTVTGIFGVKYTIAKMLDLGIEYNYVAGGFDQVLEKSSKINNVETVSANGHMVSFKVSYLINQRLEWRYVQKVRRFR